MCVNFGKKWIEEMQLCFAGSKLHGTYHESVYGFYVDIDEVSVHARSPYSLFPPRLHLLPCAPSCFSKNTVSPCPPTSALALVLMAAVGSRSDPPSCALLIAQGRRHQRLITAGSRAGPESHILGGREWYHQDRARERAGLHTRLLHYLIARPFARHGPWGARAKARLGPAAGSTHERIAVYSNQQILQRSAPPAVCYCGNKRANGKASKACLTECPVCTRVLFPPRSPTLQPKTAADTQT